MKYKITKLDKRFSGHTLYKYSVSPSTYEYTQSKIDLIAVRNWCWATYGPSAELGWNSPGSIWAWDTEHGNKRIYLKSDEELTLFALKFSG